MQQNRTFSSSGLNFFLLFFIVLGVTLRSFYIYSISLAPLPLLSMLLCFLLYLVNRRSYWNKGVNREILFFISSMMLFFVFSSFWGAMQADKLNINSIIGVYLNLFFFFLLYSLRPLLYKYSNVFNYVLVFHLTFFIVQFFMFHLYGYKLDYLESITGESQRFNGFSDIEAGGFSMFRPVGLFNEPANYSIHVICLLWLTFLSGKVNPYIEKASLLTVFLSFSLIGMLSVVAYIALTRKFKLNFKSLFVSVISSLLLIIYFGDLIVNYLYERLGSISSDSSTNVRMEAFMAVFKLKDMQQVLGVGLGNDVIDIHLPTIPFFIVTFGFIGCILIFLMFFYLFKYVKVNNKSYFFFIVISFQFYTIMHPLFWLFLCGLIIYSLQGENNKITQVNALRGKL